MRYTLSIAAFAAILALLVAGPLASSPVQAGEDAAAKATTVALKYKPSRTWRYELPAEAFVKVGGALDFSKVGGARFVTEVEGSALKVDTDGDGTTDVKIAAEGTGYVRLRSKGGFDYSVRLRNAGDGWAYAPSGARVGKIGGTKVVLIDQDGDGRYDEYGSDAMIVGSSRAACFLSRVANVAGALHSLEVARDGTSLTHTPYAGKAGRIDLAGRWQAEARLQTAIVRSEDGRHSFDLAGHPEGLAVPAGRYLLHGGSLGLGDSRVRFRRGKAAPIDVGADATAKVAGGGPLKAKFSWQRQGDEMVFTPDTLRWFGRAGEEYYAFAPFGNSPEFTVRDAKVRKEIAKAIFTGC